MSLELFVHTAEVLRRPHWQPEAGPRGLPFKAHFQHINVEGWSFSSMDSEPLESLGRGLELIIRGEVLTGFGRLRQ
jgi:hypothetical protein